MTRSRNLEYFAVIHRGPEQYYINILHAEIIDEITRISRIKFLEWDHELINSRFYESEYNINSYPQPIYNIQYSYPDYNGIIHNKYWYLPFEYIYNEYNIPFIDFDDKSLLPNGFTNISIPREIHYISHISREINIIQNHEMHRLRREEIERQNRKN